MSLDGIVLHAMVHEWQAYVGGRIHKIHQPTPHDIVLQIRMHRETVRLILSANPTYPRAHLTQYTFVNPAEAPMFCMLLRKYAEGGVIEAIHQIGLERIIHLHIRHRDELGDIRHVVLIVELMGRHSNLILIDPEQQSIIDGIHHVTPALSSYRVVMPGTRYMSPPEQHKLNPLYVNETCFFEAFVEQKNLNEEPHDVMHLQPDSIHTEFIQPDSIHTESSVLVSSEDAPQRLVERFSGISPLVARELVYRSGVIPSWQQMTTEQLTCLWSVFTDVQTHLIAHQYEPHIIEETSSGKSFFSVILLTHKQGQRTAYTDTQTCLEAYYGDKAERDTVKQRVSDMIRFLQNEINKNIKKRDKLQQSLDDAQEAEHLRMLGELLTAHMHLIHKGMTAIEVHNYYEESQPLLCIHLDTMLSPAENAQRYFKKYHKMKNSLHIIHEQMDSTDQEIEYLQTILLQLHTASLADVGEIRQELIDQHYLRERTTTKKKRKKQDKPTLSCFTSSEGIPILVGKNNTQNDFLTQRIAHAQDTWLHTKAIPGSHVVIRSKTYTDATLLEAAQIAAYHSQARASSTVPVDYTLIKHVHKPNGAKPGYVIYEHQKTLFVTPDEQQIKSLASGLYTL